MKLTKNFSLEEMTRSPTAQRLGLNNTPNEDHLVAMTALAVSVLQPLRELYGKPITVSSGFRSKALNTAIGGAKNSQHMKGEAADLIASPQPSPRERENHPDGNVPLEGGVRGANKKLYELIRDNLPFDQLIDEEDYSWIHVSFNMCGENRKRVLKL